MVYGSGFGPEFVRFELVARTSFLCSGFCRTGPWILSIGPAWLNSGLPNRQVTPGSMSPESLSAQAGCSGFFWSGFDRLGFGVVVEGVRLVRLVETGVELWANTAGPHQVNSATTVVSIAIRCMCFMDISPHDAAFSAIVVDLLQPANPVLAVVSLRNALIHIFGRILYRGSTRLNNPHKWC